MSYLVLPSGRTHGGCRDGELDTVYEDGTGGPSVEKTFPEHTLQPLSGPGGPSTSTVLHPTRRGPDPHRVTTVLNSFLVQHPCLLPVGPDPEGE